MALKIPTQANPNYVGMDIDRDSVENTEITYQYIKEATFKQYQISYTEGTTNLPATVLFQEPNPGRQSWWKSVLPFGGSTEQNAYRVAVDGRDDFKQLPCNLTADPSEVERGLLEHFGLFFFTGDSLSPGDRVLVNYALGPNSTPQSYGYITEKIAGTTTLPVTEEQCNALQDRFEQQDAQGNARPLGNRGGGNTSNHVMVSLVAAAPDVGADQVIEGTPLANIGTVVEGELSFWQGKIETDANVYRRLTTYWENVNYGNWTPDGDPWSAAFISYVVQQVDPSFPGSAAHWVYSESSSEGVGGWSLWKTSEGKIRAQEGDILVRRRSGGRTNTHGDVVYKIEGNRAILAGGNLRNTAKVASRLYISPDGFYQDTGDYEIILKKNGRVG